MVSYGGTRHVSSMTHVSSWRLSSATCSTYLAKMMPMRTTSSSPLPPPPAIYGHTIKTIRSDNDRSLVDDNTAHQIIFGCKINVKVIDRDNYHIISQSISVYRIGDAERRWRTFHSMAIASLLHSLYILVLDLSLL